MKITPEQRELVTEHLGLARNIAHNHRGLLVADPDDLYSVGCVALIHAAQRWNPANGSSFGAYARHAVNGAIIDEIRRLRWGKRNHGGADSDEQPPKSLDEHTGTGDEQDERYAFIAAPDTDPLTRVTSLEARRGVDDFLAKLTTRERCIVELRMAGASLKMIGERFGVTESRVSQILAQIGRKREARRWRAAA